MLGQRLITKQTGEQGRRCDKVFIVERLYLRREMYLSILLGEFRTSWCLMTFVYFVSPPGADRTAGGPVIIVSQRGGTSIEDVAATTPEAIAKETVGSHCAASKFWCLMLWNIRIG
jgi:succinyl-CoA synthetase beta subunit